MDMTESIAPKSDQLNAEDLLTGPRTFTIAEVKRGSVEQPVDVHLVEHPGRPFKPSKTVRRIMVGAWGPDANTYAGKRMTLYRDPAVRFGGMDVGGIRVSHMSGIDKPLTLVLSVSKGKRAPYVVKPLADDAPTTATVSPELLAELAATFTRKGIPEDKWLSGVNHYTQGKATALEVITDDQARHMLTVLAEKPDAEAVEDEPAEPTLDGV